jgi:hypothetical protein
MRNRNRRESLRVGALVLLLTVVGVAGGAWTGEAAAQERMVVLSRTPARAQANAGLPGGKDMLIAVGTLQFLGLVVFEATAYMRRRQQRRRVVIAPLVFPVPTPTHHRQAA